MEAEIEGQEEEEEEDEEELEDEDYEKDYHLSAAQLLNQHRGEEQDEYAYHEEFDDYMD